MSLSSGKDLMNEDLSLSLVNWQYIEESSSWWTSVVLILLCNAIQYVAWCCINCLCFKVWYKICQDVSFIHMYIFWSAFLSLRESLTPVVASAIWVAAVAGINLVGDLPAISIKFSGNVYHLQILSWLGLGEYPATTVVMATL